MFCRHGRRRPSHPSPASWLTPLLHFSTAMASPYEPSEELRPLKSFALAHKNGSTPSPPCFSRVISECADMAAFDLGSLIHGLAWKLGLRSNMFVASSLVNLYWKSHKMGDALKVFDEMPVRGVVACNSIISGYSDAHDAVLAFDVLFEMIEVGVKPNACTFSGLLVCCSTLGEVEIGMQIHCLVMKFGFFSNVVVGTALLGMYAACLSWRESRKVFDEMWERNAVTWTAMVNACARHEQQKAAMILVRDMLRLDLGLHSMTCSGILSSFSSGEDLDHAKQIHGQVIRRGFDSNVYVLLTLMTMYSKMLCNEEFFEVFSLVHDHVDPICGNSIIASFSHLGYELEVLRQFSKMARNSVRMDCFTFLSVLKAIGLLSAVDEGKQTHAVVYKLGYASHGDVQNGLLSMYAKCGAIEESKRVFSLMSYPDPVSWNSILSGCAQHGLGGEAVELFDKMTMSGLTPDSATFLSVLTACSHAGLLEKGLECFRLMIDRDNQVNIRMEHLACIVDLLGRSGHLEEAEKFISSLPGKLGASAFRALLSACSVHGEVDMANRAAKSLLQLCPNDPAAYVLSSRVFAQEGCWDGAAGVRRLMTERHVKKKCPGISWIDYKEKSNMRNLSMESVLMA